MTPTYSLVIPIKNEEGSLAKLIDEIEAVMTQQKDSFEIIVVDDGSTDKSASIVKELAKQKPYLSLISFKQNYGQSAAFLAGFERARGDLVITLDGDGQNDPNDIPKLLSAIEGADLVVGWRVSRKDPFQKRLLSKLATAFRAHFLNDPIHDTGCQLKVYRREKLRQIPTFKGMHRFFPALFLMKGFRVKELPVNHRPRTEGKTKYHFFSRFGTITDLFYVMWVKRKLLTYEINEEK